MYKIKQMIIKFTQREVVETLLTSDFDLGDLRFTFEASRPHRSMNQPKLRKGHFWPCNLRFWPWWPQIHFWDPGRHSSTNQRKSGKVVFFVLVSSGSILRPSNLKGARFCQNWEKIINFWTLRPKVLTLVTQIRFWDPGPHESTDQPKLRKGHFWTMWTEVLTLLTSDSLLRPLDPIIMSMNQPNWEKVIFDHVTSDFDLGDLRFTFKTPEPHGEQESGKIGKR